MAKVRRVWSKMRSTFCQARKTRTGLRRILVRDPELLRIAELAHQRRREVDKDLEKVFEKVKPILNRESRPVPAVEGDELPAALKAEIVAMPDPEQRVRTIVEFKLSSKRMEEHACKTQTKNLKRMPR
jgi:hypothetical protein